MYSLKRAFTLIELLMVIVVISILATIALVTYGSWRRSTADAVVRNDLTQAAAGLASHLNFTSSYPPNLAGIDFSASQDVGLTLYTNAPSVGVYQNLTGDQNAQLFLNVCNANLNGLDNTVCTFAGNGGGAKIHVKGTKATNTIWRSPINVSDVSLPYGPDYTAATNVMIQQFQAQGGTFPITVTGATSSLPDPTKVPNGPASKYCLEGHSGTFPDVVYHIAPHEPRPLQGACPSDPDLHYYPS